MVNRPWPCLRHSLLFLSICLFITACGDNELTYSQIQQTAIAMGCWPDTLYPTPLPITVTPPHGPHSLVLPGTPTPTPWIGATTTPLPRCTPAADATLRPWPTPLPTRPPFATQAAEAWNLGSAARVTMELPGGVDQLDLAVHPVENWPVVGLLHGPGLSDAPQTAMVRVMNPATGRWGNTQQVDRGHAAIGPGGYGGMAVEVTGDGSVHAVWGRQTIWHAQSSDYGETWSTPERLATGCWGVQDLAASPDGQLVVVTRCPEHATFIVRRADTTWLPPRSVPYVIGMAQVVIVGDGAAATAVALLSCPGDNPRRLHIASTRLDQPDWRLQTIDLHLPDNVAPGAWFANLRGLVISRQGTDMPLFTFGATNANNAFALYALNGTTDWQFEPVVWQPPFDPEEEAHAQDGLDYVAPAYDPLADRFVALLVCCKPTRFIRREATHYANWSVPGSAVWQPGAAAGDQGILVMSGAISASDTVTAQARNSRTTWLAWREQLNQVVVRSLDLHLVVPQDQYPAR